MSSFVVISILPANKAHKARRTKPYAPVHIRTGGKVTPPVYIAIIGHPPVNIHRVKKRGLYRNIYGTFTGNVKGGLWLGSGQSYKADT